MILTIEYLQKSIKETKDELLAIETQPSSTLQPEILSNLKSKTERP